MGCCGDDSKSKDDSNDEGDGGTEKYGKPFAHDPEFKGPIQNRSCTDVICCVLFILFFLGMIFVACWAFVYGNPKKLLYPKDSQGNICGTGQFSDRPYLVFFDLLTCAKITAISAAALANGCPTPQVCVAKCPESTSTYLNKLDTDIRNKLVCKYGVDPHDVSKTVESLVKNEDCAPYTISSKPIAGRCIPSIVATLLDKITDINGTSIRTRLNQTISGKDVDNGIKAIRFLLGLQDYGTKILSDLQASWVSILIGISLGGLISFIWIILMRWIAGPIVWFTILAFFALFIFTTFYSFNRYVQLGGPVNKTELSHLQITTDFKYYLNLPETWLAFGIVSAVVLFIILLVLLFLRKSICIAVALIGEASRAVQCICFSLFWPIVPFILEILLFGFWGLSAIFLASTNVGQFGMSNSTNASDFKEKISQIIPCDPNANGTAGSVCSFVKYGGNEYTKYLQFYQLFMLFWMMNFIIAFGQMTLAGAFASYYWTRSKKDLPMFPLAESVWRCFRYHLGTLAFGSLIVSIIQIIRVILEYLDHKLKKSENIVAKFFLKCLMCCFWCLEKFMRFLNKNAYIMTAVYGKNFCTSAKKAFFLIMRNIARVFVVDKVTDYLLIIGKLMVVGAITAAAYYTYSGKIPVLGSTILKDNVALNYFVIPVIVIAVGTYMVATAFFNVYTMAVDTLFLCFLEDIERNDGSEEKPYFMRKSLMKVLGKKNLRGTMKGDDKDKDTGCCGCC